MFVPAHSNCNSSFLTIRIRAMLLLRKFLIIFPELDLFLLFFKLRLALEPGHFIQDAQISIVLFRVELFWDLSKKRLLLLSQVLVLEHRQVELLFIFRIRASLIRNQFIVVFVLNRLLTHFVRVGEALFQLLKLCFDDVSGRCALIQIGNLILFEVGD